MSQYELPAELPMRWYEAENHPERENVEVTFKNESYGDPVTLEIFRYHNGKGIGMLLTTPGRDGAELQYGTRDSVQESVNLAFEIMATLNVAQDKIRL